MFSTSKTSLISSRLATRFLRVISIFHSSLFLSGSRFFSNYPEDILLKAYRKQIKSKDLFCLNHLDNTWVKEKPFKGKIVLMNCHITLITLAMIRVLIRAGARVEVTASPSLTTHDNALSAIRKSRLTFYPEGNIPEGKREGYFDVVFDCGGFMINVIKPRFGMSELTHTDESIYSNATYPVITVGQSKVKEIETRFGTGDALIRVLIYLAKESLEIQSFHHYLMKLIASMNIKFLFRERKYMIVGYGKVGKGIVSALSSAGARKENIFIIDKSPEILRRIMEDGYQGLLLDTSTHHALRASIDNIKKCLPDMYACITATGIQNVISQYFEPFDFKNVPFLINMGTPDEWGHKFPEDIILNKKKPANFMLEYPTKIIYLDPIFYLLLTSGQQLLTQKLPPGLNTVPETTDKETLAEWMHHHQKKMWKHMQKIKI